MLANRNEITPIGVALIGSRELRFDNENDD
jgi:hypothetical protein